MFVSNKKRVSGMMWYKMDIKNNLMQVRLRHKVIHMYSEYLRKSEKVPVKYNMVILTSLSIQSTCGTKLTLDGAN